MFSQNEWAKLLRTLIQQTKSGQITWEGNNDAEGYMRTVDKDTILSVRGIDGDALAPYEFVVWRRKEGSDEPIRFGAVTTQDYFNGNGADMVGELYEVIVRAVNNVDTIFENIMDKLSEPDQDGD